MDPQNKKDLGDKIRFYETVLDHVQNGIMITDGEGRVVFFSKTYADFLGILPEVAVGKKCYEVIENSRMHLVAKTGIAEINQPHRIMGQDMVVQRIPIVIEGQGVFVFGQVMFKDVKDVHTLARKLSDLESKVELYEKELVSLRSSKFTLDHIIGESEGMAEIKNLALKAAQVQAPVLILGESGTGKELFAHATHYASDRRIYPFIRLNCAAIPKDLLEAELFGYEPGAFTGAGSKGKPGKFELAHKGSIFLDEISNLPLEMQPKLLRVLEEKEIERVGGIRPVKSDFRLIVATNENLENLVEQGKFRKDLYYRLNVIPIQIPPLRERTEDIVLLAEHISQKFSRDMGTRAPFISPEVMKIFQRYYWPGNVRELSNILERILYMIDGDTIRIRHLPIFLQSMGEDLPKTQSTLLKRLHEDMEKDALIHTIRLAKDNKNKAAKLLGIHRTSLYKKMKKLNIPT